MPAPAPPRRLAAALLLSLAACGGVSDETLRAAVPADEDRYARAQLAALSRGDTLALLRDLDPQLDAPETRRGIAAMARTVAGRRIERADVVGYQSADSAGTPLRAIQYQLRLSDGWAVAHVATRTQGGRRVLEGASVGRIAEPLQATHAFRVAGKSPRHLLFLLAALVVPALMLTSVVLVFRMPLRNRPLWVLASLLGLGAWRLEWTTGASGFVPSLQLLGSGVSRASAYSPWVLVVSIPLGAVWVLQQYVEWRRGGGPAGGG